MPSPRGGSSSLAAYFVTACLGLSVTLHRGLTHRAFRCPGRWRSSARCLRFSGEPGVRSAGWRCIAPIMRSAMAPRTPRARQARMVDRRLRLRLSFRSTLCADTYAIPLTYFYTAITRHLDGLGAGAGGDQRQAGHFGFFVPAFAQITISNLANVLGHGHGYRNYETKDKSTNNVLIALLAWGEGGTTTIMRRRRNGISAANGGSSIPARCASRRCGALGAADYEPTVTSADETKTIVAAPR